MCRHSEIWTVAGVVRRQAAINPQPPYQRGPVWTLAQKQLLVDSILRDLDIPKLYLRELAEEDWLHEVIDGQQRMRAICEFRADAYPLAVECDAVPAHDIGGKLYSQFPTTYRTSRPVRTPLRDFPRRQPSRSGGDVPASAERHDAQGRRKAQRLPRRDEPLVRELPILRSSPGCRLRTTGSATTNWRRR